MSRPAISPCRASSADVNARPSTSSMLNVWVATVISFTGMFRPPTSVFFTALTTTSCSCVSDSMNTLKTFCFPLRGSVTVLLPTYEMTSLFFGLLIAKAKLPLKSVVVALMIRLLPSRSTTFAIMTGPISSDTVPETRVPCAIAA